jgi:hypothetical protein
LALRSSYQGKTMKVEHDQDMRCFKIQKDPYGPVAVANWSGNLDSFEVVDDRELVVRAYGGVVARFDAEGRLLT